MVIHMYDAENVEFKFSQLRRQHHDPSYTLNKLLLNQNMYKIPKKLSA